jgi:uncharacterized protein (DUF433 family)
MSTSVQQTVVVPLCRDSSGALRIGTTRVLLELVVRAYEAGATPEDIVQAYDTLQLQDVYAVLAWCLNNETAVEEYLSERDASAGVVEHQLQSLRPFRKDLLRSLTERATRAKEARAAVDQ